ncbi:fatty acid desaturase-domain-containing protein [Cristinia sonorae]|uniref:Fatty acid desaturase-domain-containing protein n=1 Tax=Cristinia sonorae TaxID=1940300 RepID=A0A8K0URU1_9AGAR|nr:fatty acid desaturase-domain-containing protein [Cristinia sonorae]
MPIKYTLVMLSSSPEYTERLHKPFKPPQVTLKQIHDAVPKHLLKKNPWLSTYYVVRDVALCIGMFVFASYIPEMSQAILKYTGISAQCEPIVRTGLWVQYWWWQGLVFAGFFCIAHELGHHALYDNWYANNIPAFLMHTFIMAPFFAWKASHNAHHKTVGSLERDENYIPYTRSQMKLPPPDRATRADYAEILEETPIYTAVMMFVMQAFGWWLYLGHNAMGSPRHPAGTSHLNPYSTIFTKEQRRGIIISDVALISMGTLLYYYGSHYGWTKFIAMWLIPDIICNHWIVLCTYLHHSDPTLPHYRREEWSFLRGAAATVDRPIMGWMGRFFLHNVSHDHVAHHFFSQVPFYNMEEVTQAIRTVLKDDYNYDSTNAWYALYRSFTQCVFIEDEGDIVFYKTVTGEAQRELAADYKPKDPTVPNTPPSKEI